MLSLPDLIDASSSERAFRASAALARASARCSGVNVGRANVLVLSSQLTAFAATARSQAPTLAQVLVRPSLTTGPSKRHDILGWETDTHLLPGSVGAGNLVERTYHPDKGGE
ncbi:hypothetical protein GCM10009754_52020 [Amycolatopsis minnesotensis]|uniref:Uncharacterized protein n=1 Tax=Amycolatopsis minnesotensis TaxID=337894 RepID=A0ABP5D2H6_9PSEU